MGNITKMGNNNVPDYKKYLFDLSKQIEEPEPLLTLPNESGEDIGVLYRGSLSMITGSAGSGKSFVATWLIGQAYEQNEGKLKVLLVDTEQQPIWIKEEVERIHKLLRLDTSKNYDNIQVLNLKDCDYKERINITGQAIQAIRPDFVIIDGIRDLTGDFNSVEASGDVIINLLKWSAEYDCHILSVLHLNKVNGEARGHLGTELNNKIDVCFYIPKDGEKDYIKDLYTVKAGKNRMGAFAMFRIKRVDDLPLLDNDTLKDTNSKKHQKLKGLFTSICENGKTYSYTDLVKAITDKVQVKENMAKKKISSATGLNIIQKLDDGLYKLPQDDDVPFSYMRVKQHIGGVIVICVTIYPPIYI